MKKSIIRGELQRGKCRIFIYGYLGWREMFFV